MSLHFKIGYIFILLLILLSCESITELPGIDSAESVVVIEAIVTDKFESQKVRVSRSVPLNDTLNGIPVMDAKVTLYFSNSDRIDFSYSHDDGTIVLYLVPADLEYTIEVLVNDSVYIAKGKMVEMDYIDSVYYEKSYNKELKDSAYFIYINGIEPNDDVKYYYLDIIHNHDTISKGGNIYLFSSRFIENIPRQKLPDAFQQNDTVIIEFHAISKEMFEYYYVFANQFLYNYSSNGIVMNPPKMFEGGAIGYFHISQVLKKEFILK
ncbi:MAG: DUF4249 domain-containing protein [Bacteroidales bacterium]|nr:DUF4249 domain-containing protein [Bacteroidales bacterium]